ncbi:MAG: hypothetical protein ACPGSC_14065 [Granulosicoccaceae bacterium]
MPKLILKRPAHNGHEVLPANEIVDWPEGVKPPSDSTDASDQAKEREKELKADRKAQKAIEKQIAEKQNAALQKLKDEHASELQKADDELAALQKELDALKKAKAADAPAKVATPKAS